MGGRKMYSSATSYVSTIEEIQNLDEKKHEEEKSSDNK